MSFKFVFRQQEKHVHFAGTNIGLPLGSPFPHVHSRSPRYQLRPPEFRQIGAQVTKFKNLLCDKRSEIQKSVDNLEATMKYDVSFISFGQFEPFELVSLVCILTLLTLIMPSQSPISCLKTTYLPFTIRTQFFQTSKTISVRYIICDITNNILQYIL